MVKFPEPKLSTPSCSTELYNIAEASDMNPEGVTFKSLLTAWTCTAIYSAWKGHMIRPHQHSNMDSKRFQTTYCTQTKDRESWESYPAPTQSDSALIEEITCMIKSLESGSKIMRNCAKVLVASIFHGKNTVCKLNREVRSKVSTDSRSDYRRSTQGCTTER